MATTTSRQSLSYHAELALRTIFKRCQECDPGTPSCPSCGDGEVCSLVPQDCNTCAHMTCIADPSSSPSSPSGPNIGAIAGGVVGGVLAVVVVVALLWYFFIRRPRHQELAEWEDEIAQQKRGTLHPDAASTRTRQSLANSFLSRASNIIQIAYIPGVTNRNGSERDSMLGSNPVPPIPAAFRNQNTNGTTTPRSPLSNDGDALFFRPGDLRDSTYSATSSFRSTNRDTQYTTTSITPSLARASMASDIYRDDATTEPMPATTGMRLLPRMISVKSSQQSLNSQASQGSQSPAEGSPVPSGVQVMVPAQSSSRATPVRGKATQVTVGGRSRASSRPGSPGSREPTVTVDGGATKPGQQAVPSETAPSPYSQLSANVSSLTPEERARRHNVNKLSAVIEEGVKRASRVPSHEGLGGKRNPSPFGDEHATS